MRGTAAAMLGDRVDLTTLDTSKPRPWTRGGYRFLRPGVKAIAFSPRGVGKTLMADLLAVQVIEEGGSVVYLDLENGVRRQAERFAAILADRPSEVKAAVAERLDYRPHVRLGKLGGDAQEWVEHFVGRDLVILDSTPRALAQYGADENSNADVGRFMVEIIDPIAEAGAAVLQLDNTGHDEQTRTRGGSAKLDLSELAYKVTADRFGPDRHGTIRLQRVRTRDGDEAIHLEAGAGAGSYGRLVPALPAGEQRLDETLVEYVAQHPGQKTAEVAKGVGKRKGDAQARLEALERAGTVHRGQSQGQDRRGRTISFTAWYLGPESQSCLVPPDRTEQDPPSSEPVLGPGSPPIKAGPGPQAGPNGALIDEALARYGSEK